MPLHGKKGSAEQRKAPKIVVITGLRTYQKAFCVEIARFAPDACYFHYPKPKYRYAKALFTRKTSSRITPALLLALAPLPGLGWRQNAAITRAEQQAFPSADEEYKATIAARATALTDPESERGIESLLQAAPDIVVCLGGPIYGEKFLNSMPLVINIHTGISPFYNGAKAAFWAFANGDERLCGTTLMIMSEKIDQGNILAHYLPKVHIGEDPADVFMKLIVGGSRLVREFVQGFSASGPFCSVRQSKSRYYFRARDWTVHQRRAISRWIDSKPRGQTFLDEEVFEYWRNCDDDQAQRILETNLQRWVKNDKGVR